MKRINWKRLIFSIFTVGGLMFLTVLTTPPYSEWSSRLGSVTELFAGMCALAVSYIWILAFQAGADDGPAKHALLKPISAFMAFLGIFSFGIVGATPHLFPVAATLFPLGLATFVYRATQNSVPTDKLMYINDRWYKPGSKYTMWPWFVYKRELVPTRLILHYSAEKKFRDGAFSVVVTSTATLPFVESHMMPRVEWNPETLRYAVESAFRKQIRQVHDHHHEMTLGHFVELLPLEVTHLVIEGTNGARISSPFEISVSPAEKVRLRRVPTL